MPAVATLPKLPPFWGNSYWWTRTGALLGVALLLTGIAMKYGVVGTHVGSCGLPNRLTNPILAIEVAANWVDVLAMVGPCQATHCLQSMSGSVCYQGVCNLIVCPDKVAALTSLQTWDRAFIVIYWVYFLYLGLINWRFCAWRRFAFVSQAIAKLAGLAAVVLATLGAVADWREDDRILQALLQVLHISSTTPLMRDFAYHKWKFLFLAIGLASPVFIFWPNQNNPAGTRRSAFSQTLAWLTSLVALTAAWTGVTACLSGDDAHLELASQLLALVMILSVLTLATASYWRGGTMAALDRLAELPVLSFLTNLFARN
jgi:hypothetical protein